MMTKAIAIEDDLYSLIVAKDKGNEKLECTKVEHENELRVLVVNVLVLQTNGLALRRGSVCNEKITTGVDRCFAYRVLCLWRW